jgi:hypothetical protein
MNYMVIMINNLIFTIIIIEGYMVIICLVNHALEESDPLVILLSNNVKK